MTVTSGCLKTGKVVAGLEPKANAQVAAGLMLTPGKGADSSASNFTLFEGAEYFETGATGGVVSIPSQIMNGSLDSDTSRNVVRVTLQPSGATASYECAKDTRTDTPTQGNAGPVFTGDAATLVANDSCAKQVAQDVYDQIVNEIQDLGLDFPDELTFSKISKTSSGYTDTVNGFAVQVTVDATCKVTKIPNLEKAARAIGG